MLHVINIGFERVNVKFFRSLDKDALMTIVLLLPFIFLLCFSFVVMIKVLLIVVIDPKNSN